MTENVPEYGLNGSLLRAGNRKDFLGITFVAVLIRTTGVGLFDARTAAVVADKKSLPYPVGDA